MRIAVLTSSRADFGIYLPLLKKLKKDKFFSFDIVAFGTHLSKLHGYTVKAIEEEDFPVKFKIHTLPRGDRPSDISEGIGNTIINFKRFWEKNKSCYDLVFCLGDRYEMFAAVSAAAPFAIPFAHIHGGETTEGAMDNSFRHSITSFSELHFTSHPNYSKKVFAITGKKKNVYTVGALSLDNLFSIKILDKVSFLKKFHIRLSDPVLVTFHPETIHYEKNGFFINELMNVLSQVNSQIIMTMPNADTQGSMIRKQMIRFAKGRPNVHIVESFGTQGYFSCMKHASFILGNSSSGIIEAASFYKYVINIGDRQKGRLTGKNVLHSPINSKKILKTVKKLRRMPPLKSKNIYGDGKAADRIIRILKKTYA